MVLTAGKEQIVGRKPGKKKRKGRWRNRVLWFFAIDLLLLGITLLGGMMYIRHRLNSLPVVDAQYLKTYEPSKILDKNGSIIWQPTDQRAVSLTYEEIPEFYETAIVAVEDEEFWDSPGISIKGVANMIYGVLRSKIDEDYKPRGGSTIEQQLIKNKFYDGGRGHDVTTRKVQELFLAMQLNENFSKKEILTFYVNDLEYAEGCTGLGAIMKTYFAKNPSDYQERNPETIAELAYLAGLSQAPAKYNLYTDPDAAAKRKDLVLKILRNGEQITEVEYQKAKAFDLTTNLQPRNWEAKEQVKKNLKFKHYTDGVMDEIEDMGYDISKLSVTIKTFLDPKVYQSVTSLVQDPKYYLDDDQQTGVAVIDTDGIVVALVGSSKSGDEFNRALSDTRSSGSSMKPFTAYGPLLQYFGDKYTTASEFDTSAYKYPGTNTYMRNYGGGVYGMQTMQRALRKSYNTPVARIDDQILGSVRMKTFLHGLGLDSKKTYSSVDGIGLNVSPLQSAAAYNALSNGGVYIKPRFIDEIVFSDNTVRKVKAQKTKAMNPSVAYVLTQILRGVPETGGTAPKAKIPSYEGYAGKTGSVKFDKKIKAPSPYGNGGSDVWYCSYTNGGYAISVWCGYDVPNKSPRIPSYYHGQQLINRDLQKLLNGKGKIPDWDMPEGVEKISGEGLSSYYRVTDARDVKNTGIAWADVENYKVAEMEQVNPDTSIPEDWEGKEESPWFSYYKQNGSELPDVIDQETYDRLKGDGQ